MIRSVAAVAVVAVLSIAGLAVAQNAAKDVPKDAAKEAPKTSAFTPAQREELDKLIHAYIVKNPEVLVEATTALEAKQVAEQEAEQKEAVAKNAKALKDSPEGTVIGNLKGDVTVIEFFDYNCGYCKGIFAKLMDAVKEDGKVRLVLKELPILGPNSMIAARAALASVKQGKYQPYHIAMMSHKGSLNEETIMKIAKDVGLDVAKLQEDMKAEAIDKVFETNEDLAHSIHLEGTPTIVVNDAPVRRSVEDVESGEIKNIIKKARAKS